MGVCMIFFGLSWVLYKWLFTNVYSEEFDCGGEFWHELFNGVMVGMLLGTLSLCGLSNLLEITERVELGIMTSKYSIGQIVIWLVPCGILLFQVYCNRHLAKLSQTMTYQ